MQNSLNAIGCFIVYIAAIVGCFLVLGLIVTGGAWLAIKILPILIVVAVGLFVFNVVVCLPMALFKKTKEFSGKALFLSSYIYGALLWLACLVITFKLWGWFGIVVGLLLLGIGLVPIAIVATIIGGLWGVLLNIIILLVVIWLARMIGLSFLRNGYVFEKSEAFNSSRGEDEDVIDVTPIEPKDEEE